MTLKSLMWPCGTMALFSVLELCKARLTQGQYKIYIFVMKVLGCGFLVSATFMVSVLVSKLLSTGYHRATQDKMQAVILRGYCLVLVLAINSLEKNSIEAWTGAVREDFLVLERPTDLSKRRETVRAVVEMWWKTRTPA